MRRNSVGWNDASADHINRKHEQMIEKRGRSPAKIVLDSGAVETINRMADDMTAALGNDVSHLLGNLTHESANMQISGALNQSEADDFFRKIRAERALDLFYGTVPRPSEGMITLDAYLMSSLGLQALLIAYTDPRKVGFWL